MPLFDLAFDDGTVAWHLTGETWEPRTVGPDGVPLRDLQEILIQRTRSRRGK